LSAVAARLEEIIRRTPKTGYKASVYMGILSKLASLADDAKTLADLAQCYGAARELCKKKGETVLCTLGCGGINALRRDGEWAVWKFGSNAFAAKVEEGRVELKTEKTRLVIEPSQVKVYLRAGEGWDEITVDLRDQDDVFRKGYFIRYSVRDVGKPLTVAINDLRACARQYAITC